MEGQAPTLPDTESKRLTAEDAERSKAEKEAAMSKLMDDMEASVETQGQYFVRLGDKVPLTQPQQETQSVDTEIETGVVDQRVLILNALEDDPHIKGYSRAIMIIRDGIKIVKMDRKSGGTSFGLKYDIISKLKAGSEPVEGTGFSSDRKQIQLGYINEAGVPTSINLSTLGFLADAKPFTESPELFQKAVRDSIDQTESPHKATVEKNTAEAQLANSSAGFIQNLPPRT